MALRPYPGFVGPSYTPQSKISAFDRTVNWYPERVESGTGTSTYVLYPAPGYVTNATLPTSPGRAIFTINGVLYVLYGTSLYIVSEDVTLVAQGFSDLDGSLAQIISNGDAGQQLLIRADTTLYVFDINDPVPVTLTTIPDITSNQIGFLNGYGLSLDSLLSQVNFSALEDFTSWDPLDVFQRNDVADRWRAMIVHHKEIWLFGAETTSVYYNSGDADTPFQPIVSVLVPIGIAAPASACEVDGQLMWIGQGINGAGVVYRANGYTPERVSTHAVEFAIQAIREANVDALTLAEGSTYQEDGHVFYELTFPTSDGVDGQTWVYDATSGLWHERGQWNSLEFTELDTRGHGQINGAQYTVSRTTGAFYRQWVGYSTGTDGTGIVRLRRAPHINQAQQRIRYNHFRLLMESGLGSGSVVSTDPAYDPQITLSWSNDGGQTFGTAYPISAGRIGEFSKLVEWRQLEQAQDRIFQLTCSAPVPWRLIDAFLDYSVGPS